MMQKLALIAVPLALLACSEPEGTRPPPQGDGSVSAIDGQYRFLAGERDGEPIDSDELAEGSVVIQGGLITTYDSEDQETYVTQFDLDTSTEPWEISMTAVRAPGPGNADEAAEGLVQQDQEVLTLVYALPGGEKPTTLSAGEDQQLFRLQRVAD